MICVSSGEVGFDSNRCAAELPIKGKKPYELFIKCFSSFLRSVDLGLLLCSCDNITTVLLWRGFAAKNHRLYRYMRIFFSFFATFAGPVCRVSLWYEIKSHLYSVVQIFEYIRGTPVKTRFVQNVVSNNDA